MTSLFPKLLTMGGIQPDGQGNDFLKVVCLIPSSNSSLIGSVRPELAATVLNSTENSATLQVP